MKISLLSSGIARKKSLDNLKVLGLLIRWNIEINLRKRPDYNLIYKIG